MPKIDSKELSALLNSLSKLRADIANQLIMAEQAAMELIETQELAGAAWQNTKQYFTLYPLVTKGIWNGLGVLIKVLQQYIMSFETEVGASGRRLDSEGLQEFQNRLNLVHVRKQKMLEQFTNFSFADIFGEAMIQEVNDCQADELRQKVEILVKYREFELAHANDFNDIKESFINLNTGLTKMALEKGVGNPKFGYAPGLMKEAACFKNIERLNQKQATYELITYPEGKQQWYNVYRNGVLDDSLSDKYRLLLTDEEIRCFFTSKGNLSLLGLVSYKIGIDSVTGNKVFFSEWRQKGFWLALDQLTVSQMTQIIQNIRLNQGALEGLELTNEEFTIFSHLIKLGNYTIVKNHHEM